MIDVAACVCTRHRHEGLRLLLAALARQRLDGSGVRLTVVVIDNSAGGDALPTVSVAAQATTVPVRFIHEPRQGLTFARNRALAEARSLGARYLAFIDDDEIPDRDWLRSLASAVQRPRVAAAIGPVNPFFVRPPGRWLPIEAYRAEAPTKDGYALSGYTGNCIIDLERIDGLQFDNRYNTSGGEDTDFFASLVSAGYLMAWADTATVLEAVPAARMSVGWLCRRWYRTGANEARMAIARQSGPKPRMAALGKGAVRIAGGSLRLALAVAIHAWARPDRVTASLYTLSRGAGYVGAAIGRIPRPYSR